MTRRRFNASERAGAVMSTAKANARDDPPGAA